MNKKYFANLCFLVLLFFLISSFGCSTIKSFVYKIESGEPDLKKRVMFLPVIDQANIGKGLISYINADLIENLNKSPQLLLYEYSKTPLDLVKRPPGFGIMAQPELIEKADDLDMNAIISGILNSIEITTKKKGIWPFRKSCWVLETSMIMNVVDVISKTVLLSHLESYEVSFSFDEAESQNEKEIFDQALKKSLPFILKRQASHLIECLGERPWTGKILGIDNGTIKINAGKNIGLKPGHRFEVFARGESIPSAEGRVFFLLGKKMGEIKVSKVLEKHSLAVPVKEGAFLSGQIISSRH